MCLELKKSFADLATESVQVEYGQVKQSHWSLLISHGSKMSFAPSVSFPRRVKCGNLKEWKLSLIQMGGRTIIFLSQYGSLALQKGKQVGKRVFMSVCGETVHGKQEVDLRQCTKGGWELHEPCF